jgi:hypothetical protein
MPIEVLHLFAPFVNEDFSVMHGETENRVGFIKGT